MMSPPGWQTFRFAVLLYLIRLIVPVCSGMNTRKSTHLFAFSMGLMKV
jgi:hypothetical protein